MNDLLIECLAKVIAMIIVAVFFGVSAWIAYSVFRLLMKVF